MKFKDPITGEYKTLHLKTGDTLPVGTIVSFEGDEIPEGYEEVIGEEARVVISPTEPTTGEEVWIQKGKNLFNPNTDIEFTDGYRDWYGKGAKIDDDSKFGLKIQVEPNKTYVTNSDIPYEEYHNLCFFNGEMVFISSNAYNTNDKTFTTPENCTYVTIALPKTYTWFELEEGSTYTSKKIYTKNNNGVYEEFLKVYDLTPKSIPIVLADFVKSGAVEVIRSGNVVVVEVSDVMFKEDRAEWNTVFAYGLPKPFATNSDVWKKGFLTDNKGVIGINGAGDLLISERTGTQSTSSIYNGQFTYTTTD